MIFTVGICRKSNEENEGSDEADNDSDEIVCEDSLLKILDVSVASCNG